MIRNKNWNCKRKCELNLKECAFIMKNFEAYEDKIKELKGDIALNKSRRISIM